VRHHEDAEQALLFEWASYHPTLRCMFAIPNGAHLAGDARQRGIQMGRLKKQGFKSGVSDIFLPIPVGDYHGMFIEMKRRMQDGPTKVSRKQQDFLDTMKATGYHVMICYGADHAIADIKDYLEWS